MKLLILLLVLCWINFVDTKLNNLQSQIDNFSWSSNNGTNYMGPIRNQNQPAFCMSSWAFSVVNMLNSRIKIMRNASSPDIALSVQVLLSCDELDYGCMGGQPRTALKWIQQNNITDSSCRSYTGKGYTNGETCTSEAKCQKCQNGICKGMTNSKIYAIQNNTQIWGVQNMTNEIYNSGPIVCGIALTDQLKQWVNKSSIFNDQTKALKIQHYVTIVGWGTINQKGNSTAYWQIMNSWGSNWGINGYFRLIKGINNLGIESRCYASTPIDTWTEDIRNDTLPSMKTNYNTIYNDYITSNLMPSSSMLTPSSCNISSAFAISQMLTDRIYRSSKSQKQIQFAKQVLLNCGIGTCQKGMDPFDVLLFIRKYGIPEENCQNYLGSNPYKQSCSAVNNCASCKGSIFKYNCSEVKGFKRWKILDYGFISGSQSMKQQIYNYGPIVCGISYSEVFHAYTGGVFSEISIKVKISEYVEVVGWGTTNAGKQYWIGRNFRGTAWGQSGYFRIEMNGNNLAIESKCYWGNIND